MQDVKLANSVNLLGILALAGATAPPPFPIGYWLLIMMMMPMRRLSEQKSCGVNK